MQICTATQNVTDEKGRELQVHGDLAFPCAVYESKNLGFPWHWHDEFEMIYIRSGSLVIAAGSERFDVSAGDAVFINASIPHALFPNDQRGYEEYDIVFHPRLIYGNTESILWKKYVHPFIRCSELQGMRFHVSPFSTHVLHACLDCNEKRGLYEFEVKRELEAAFMEAWKVYDACCTSHTLAENPVSIRVKKAMQYIQQNLDKPLHLGDIAEVMHVSGRACQRDFLAYLGMGPVQFLTQSRLVRAASLLRSTERGITEICFDCGFNDPSNFARLFKQANGKSPRDYRKVQG